MIFHINYVNHNFSNKFSLRVICNMSVSGDKTFVSNYLLYLLAASSELASEQFHQQIRDQGLRVPEWRVLACLVDNDNMMITHLARLSLMEQSRMTRIADQMTQNGLLERCEDSNDKRRVRVRLTNKGRKIAIDLVGQARVHEKKLLSTLKDTDASHIKHALQALLQTLDENTNELPPVLKREA